MRKNLVAFLTSTGLCVAIAAGIYCTAVDADTLRVGTVIDKYYHLGIPTLLIQEETTPPLTPMKVRVNVSKSQYDALGIGDRWHQ